MERLINRTSPFIKELLIDENEFTSVTATLEECGKEVNVFVNQLMLTPHIYHQREKTLAEIAEKGYNELVSKVKDTLWLKINLIGFVYEWFYNKV